MPLWNWSSTSMDSVEHMDGLQHTQISIDDRQMACSAPSTSSNQFPSRQVSASNSNWQLRELVEQDLEAVCHICRESFPLEYPESWFREVVTGKFISFGLYYGDVLTSLLVAEVKPAALCDKEDRDLCSTPTDTFVLYILSLAVRSEFRRRGIATVLLNHLMKTVVKQEPHPKIVFLHVLSKNYAAINFYKQNGFRHHSTLPNYYTLVEDGLNVFYDGLTFGKHFLF